MLTTEQVAQCRVGSKENYSMTMQRLVAFRDLGYRCIILNTFGSIFWMFSVVDVAIAATTDERELQCRCNVFISMVVLAMT